MSRSQLSKQVFMFSPKAEKQMKAVEVDIEQNSQPGSSMRTDSQIKLVNLHINSGTQTNTFLSNKQDDQVKTMTMYEAKKKNQDSPFNGAKAALPLKYVSSEAEEGFPFSEDQDGI